MSFHKTLALLRRDAREIYRVALDAAHAGRAVQRSLRVANNNIAVEGRIFKIAARSRIWVVGAGKASATMARAVETILGPSIAGGAVVTKYGHRVGCRRIQIVEAAHPHPDSRSVEAGRRILECVRQAGDEDLVLVLLSGGGSALMELPRAGLSLEEIQATSHAMQRSRFTIGELNTVRKHLSCIKGGGLAENCRARMIVLALSDVIGDELTSIASGPTCPDPTTFADCLALLARLPAASVPAAVVGYLRRGSAGRESETLKQSPAHVHHFIIGSNRRALQAACRAGHRLGYRALVLSSTFSGDNSELARLHASIAAEIEASSQPLAPPACILSGGETTLVVQGDGIGGRNLEFALQVVEPLSALQNPTVILSLGTDGTDGPTDAAGAIVDNRTFWRAARLGLKPSDFLARNDSYHFFQELGGLIRTGPTHTNVMDLHLILTRP